MDLKSYVLGMFFTQTPTRSLQECLDSAKSSDRCFDESEAADTTAPSTFQMRGLYELIPDADCQPIRMNSYRFHTAF
jgi:hypothetical protein